MKKLLFCLALLGLVACNENKPANNSEEPQPQEETQYAEVAVPSGSQWAASVEVKADDPLNHFTAEEAIAQFEGKIPTKAQWEELLAYSSHRVTEQGIELTIVKKQQRPSAKNARRAPQAEDDDQLLKILLPYAGYVDCEGANQDQDIAAYLWTSTIDEQTKAMMYMVYSASGYHFTVGEVCDYIAMSVLTVEDNTVEVEEPEVPEVEGVHPSNSELLGGWRIVGNIPAYLEEMYEYDMQKYDEAPTWFLDGFENIVVGHIGETPDLGFGTYMYSESLGAFTLVYPRFHEEDLQGVLTKDPEGNITFSCFKPGTEEVINVVFEKVSDEYPFYQGPVIPVEEREHPTHSELLGGWRIVGNIPAYLEEMYEYDMQKYDEAPTWFLDGFENIVVGHIGETPDLGFGTYMYSESLGAFTLVYPRFHEEDLQGVLTKDAEGNITFSCFKPGTEEVINVVFEKVSDNYPFVEPEDPNFIDLGLPSGTKWKIENEVNLDQNNCFGLADMLEMASQVPTQSQWKELQQECTWKWNFEEWGFDVTSKHNGRSIFLPAAGFYSNRGTFVEEEKEGAYWSSTLVQGSQYAFQWFNPAKISLLSSIPTAYSIRRVNAAREVEVSSGTVDHNLHPTLADLKDNWKMISEVPTEFKAAQVFGGGDDLILSISGTTRAAIGSVDQLINEDNGWTFNEEASLLHLNFGGVLDITGLVFNGPEENQIAFMYTRPTEDEPVVVIFQPYSAWAVNTAWTKLPNETRIRGTWGFTGDIVSQDIYIARHQRNGCLVYFGLNNRIVIGNGNYRGEGTYSYDWSNDLMNATISNWAFYITDMYVFMSLDHNELKFISIPGDQDPYVFTMEYIGNGDQVPIPEE